jgi:PIN domain nuclease of toxin-antitoxin system
MRLLIDSHYLIWMAADRSQLRAWEKSLLLDPDVEVIVSAVSIWELRMKVRAERRRGRSELTLSPAGAIAFCKANDVSIWPLSVEDCTVVLRTEPTNFDAFDEMIVVHAQLSGARLLTRDEHLEHHPLAYHP